MAIRINFKDYNIYSKKIYNTTLVIYIAIVATTMVAEYFFDLATTSLTILTPYFISGLLLIGLSIKYPKSKIIGWILIFLLLSMLENHFIVNPKTFHIISFWLIFIPIITLLVLGIRQALIILLLVFSIHIINFVYLISITGEAYNLSIKIKPFFVSSSIFIIGNVFFSLLLYKLLGNAYVEMSQKKSALDAKNETLLNYHQELLSINKIPVESDINKQFEYICKKAAQILNISRVSIWLYKDNNQTLVNTHQFNQTDAFKTMSKELSVNDFTAYFKYLNDFNIILAPNVREHAATRDLADSYLIPLHISSLLDCSIIVDGIPIGIICCENQYKTKEFNIEDALFIQSLSDYIAISYKNERIKILLNEIQEKNIELTNKNEKIEQFNEKLTTLNESLETAVKKRTQELETQNEQLSEYAFINSHVLRAPLSRIMGLAYLINQEITLPKDQKLLTDLINSSNELDSIVKKISEILYDGNNLKREDIRIILDKNFNISPE